MSILIILRMINDNWHSNLNLEVIIKFELKLVRLEFNLKKTLYTEKIEHTGNLQTVLQ